MRTMVIFEVNEIVNKLFFCNLFVIVKIVTKKIEITTVIRASFYYLFSMI